MQSLPYIYQTILRTKIRTLSITLCAARRAARCQPRYVLRIALSALCLTLRCPSCCALRITQSTPCHAAPYPLCCVLPATLCAARRAARRAVRCPSRCALPVALCVARRAVCCPPRCALPAAPCAAHRTDTVIVLRCVLFIRHVYDSQVAWSVKRVVTHTASSARRPVTPFIMLKASVSICRRHFIKIKAHYLLPLYCSHAVPVITEADLAFIFSARRNQAQH